MFIALISLLIIVCIGLVVLILIQPGESAGLSQAFGGSSQRTIFGARSSTFLVRTTGVLAALFLLSCLLLAILSAKRKGSLMDGIPPAEEVPVTAEDVLPTAGEGAVPGVAEEDVPLGGKTIDIKEVTPAAPPAAEKTAAPE